MQLFFKWFFISFFLGTFSSAMVIILLAELRWRDPRFKSLHRRLW